MIDRRSFVTRLAAAAIGTASLPRLGRGGLGAARLEHIGVQLYTVRQAMQADFEGTLARVARIGYDEVEFAGYFDRTAAHVRATLDRNGLRSPAAHISVEAIRGDWSRTIADAQTIGHEYLICAWINDDDRTADGYRRVAAEFNRAAETARKAGIGFAYHNHVYEFTPVGGRLPYDILLAETDPHLVKFEMDLFWIIKAGGDPLAYFAKYPGRFPLVHVKDMNGIPDGPMVDVGQGTIDFRNIFVHRRHAGIRHFLVEHDEPADPFASITASYAYLRRLRF